MAKYLVVIEGFDPTSIGTTPTNSELLQMVRQAQFASDVGGVILSDTTPDVALYPILARFRWAKTTAGVLDGLFYYHDGSSWVLERPAPGTVDADSIADGTITLDKLSPDGDPLDIIRINAGGNGFQFLPIVNAIAAGSIEFDKLALASGQNYLLISNGAGTFEAKTAAYCLAALINGGTLATTINSTADIVGYRNAADGNAYKITIADFAKELIRQLTELTTTAAGDFVGVMDVSDSNVVKKVQIQNLLVDTGVAAGAYANPTSVTVNAKGQVTAIATASGQSVRTSSSFEATQRTLPTTAGSAGQLQVAHGLPGEPIDWGMKLKCTALDGAIPANTVINYRDLVIDIDGDDINFSYQIYPDATNLTLIIPTLADSMPVPVSMWAIVPSTGAKQQIDPAKWVGYLWATT